jgi:septal ring factor EnvC (AmiA/AmiB activator)
MTSADIARTWVRRVYSLVDCPNCGTEVATAVKCWTVTPVKHSAKGYIPAFRVGIFVCPHCKSKFRAKVGATAKPAETNVTDLVTKLKEIREGLTQTLRTLREKITTLETERTSLFVEIEQLKKVAESRANALETEVHQLREELKSLRELLGAGKETA